MNSFEFQEQAMTAGDALSKQGIENMLDFPEVEIHIQQDAREYNQSNWNE